MLLANPYAALPLNGEWKGKASQHHSIVLFPELHHEMVTLIHPLSGEITEMYKKKRYGESRNTPSLHSNT